jgi:hypothetical protein
VISAEEVCLGQRKAPSCPTSELMVFKLLVMIRFALKISATSNDSFG